MIKKRFLMQLLLGITIIMSSALLLFTPISSQAEEIRFPAPAYEGEELEKVIQWEKTWVGKKIDLANVDQVKEFIPESLYQVMKDPETWGECWFEIVPYREIKPTKGEIEFTRKYAGTCNIGPEDSLLNYICGIPFPTPKEGLEIAYNFDYMNQGDNTHNYEIAYIIDGKNRYNRKKVFDTHYLYFSGRREIPPVPEILPNPRGIFRASHTDFLEPATMRGQRSMKVKWIDRTKDYGSWVWSTSTRKLVRKSTAKRGDTSDSDMSSDDNRGYDNTIPSMRYEYLGRRELLLARHQDLDQLKKGHKEGYCLFNGFQRERINTYVVKCIHKDPTYLYNKQIWYLDPETWWILYADKYDKKDRLWKFFDQAEYVVKSIYNDVLIGKIGLMLIVDIQQVHSTIGLNNFTIGGTGEYYQPEYYSPKALQKYGY